MYNASATRGGGLRLPGYPFGRPTGGAGKVGKVRDATVQDTITRKVGLLHMQICVIIHMNDHNNNPLLMIDPTEKYSNVGHRH